MHLVLHLEMEKSLLLELVVLKNDLISAVQPWQWYFLALGRHELTIDLVPGAQHALK